MAQADEGASQVERSPFADSGVAAQEFVPGLYVVATPLGNAADVTLRALWVLRRADCIAAEDTRTTAPLLERFGIGNCLVSLHRHNEGTRIAALLERLQRGERVALVSDAGTPAICDPGALLVRAALDAGLRVVPVPGPSSLSAALCVAGILAGHEIRFTGFAPTHAAARARLWKSLTGSAEAAVLFEAPHRIERTLRELHAALEPARRIVIARELTKKFESVVQASAGTLLDCLPGAPPRGEYVLVVDAAPAAEPAGAGVLDAATARWLAALAEVLPASRAAAVAAKASGLPRELLYRHLVTGA